MRTNQVSSGSTITYRRQSTYMDGSTGAWREFWTSNRTDVVWELVRDDIVKTNVAAGFRSPLPYSASGWSYYKASLEVLAEQLIPGTAVLTHHVAGVDPDAWSRYLHPKDLISSGDVARAVINMVRNVGNQKFAAGEMFAEMSSSIELVSKSASTLSNAILKAARKDWKGVAKALGVKPKRISTGASASSGWLEYSFGWSPIVADMANSVLFLNDMFAGEEPLTIMSRTELKSVEVHKRNADWSQPIGTGGIVTWPCEAVDTLSHDFKASVYYTMSKEFLRDLSGYGIIGVSTPWAVVPLSFLVDWVVPIGDWLEAMDATIGLTYLGGSYTHFRKVDSVRTFEKPICTQNDVKVLSGFGYALPDREFDMKRTVWESSPLPFPAYVKNPFSAFKAVTGIALLKQLAPGELSH